jgi:TRAP-type C4-dicarboxylate transport system permease small subunit
LSRFTGLLSGLFGWMFIALSVIVVAETVSRKLFAYSLQGADELGGYILAVGSGIAFTVAFVERAHIRIDLFQSMLPRVARALLDWFSVVSMAALALLFVYVGWLVVDETIEFQSNAPTPWATPLIYPQGAWYATLVVFAVVTTLAAIRATLLLARRRFDRLAADFGPKGAEEELRAELEDLGHRPVGEPGK